MWVPGVWLWRQTRYAWRPGYWAAVNPDWVWVPAHYVWTPNGFVFIDGYWDYPFVRRGLLFAPVTFARLRPGLVYTPSVALDLRFLVDSLFVSRRRGHYYFGDYYDSHFVKSGYYPWFAFHNSRHGYDPLYAHMRIPWPGATPGGKSDCGRNTTIAAITKQRGRRIHSARTPNGRAKRLGPAVKCRRWLGRSAKSQRREDSRPGSNACRKSNRK